ncbi:hypothetical protein WMY93_010547 [Mugilogobius chulae]|uniref:Uncharacterized protein n=1 Tax=Mugilogobius chulae TaxID=88201 RepID=A0AAW0PK62_9GOBI
MEPVQDLFEDEDYLEQELEAMSLGLPPPDGLTNASSLPIIQSPPLSPTHPDQIYLTGGSPMAHLSLSVPTHQNHYRHSPPQTSPVHQASYRYSPPPGGMDQSPPPSPLRRAAQYRASPPLESVCMYRSQSGSPVRFQTEQLPGRPKSPLAKMSSQRSFQLTSQPSMSSQHHQAQGLRLQPSIAQIVRTNQPSVMGNSSYGGHPMSTRYQASVDLVYQPSLDGRSMPQVQASLSSGALSPLLCLPRQQWRSGGIRYSQTPQISRSQSAAYYPVSEHVLERANAMPPCQLGSPEIPHMVRRPVSANTTEMKMPTPRPLIHSQSVGLRFSPSTNNITGSTSNLAPGFRPSSSIQGMEIHCRPHTSAPVMTSLPSPPRAEGCTRVRHTLQEYSLYGHHRQDSANSAVPAPALQDTAHDLHGLCHQPHVSGTAGAAGLHLQPPSLTRQHCLLQQDQQCPKRTPAGGGLLPDAAPLLGEAGQRLSRGGDILERVSQVPTYPDVKVARTLPVAQAYQDNMYRQMSRESRSQGPTSPSNQRDRLWSRMCDAVDEWRV